MRLRRFLITEPMAGVPHVLVYVFAHAKLRTPTWHPRTPYGVVDPQAGARALQKPEPDATTATGTTSVDLTGADIHLRNRPDFTRERERYSARIEVRGLEVIVHSFRVHTKRSTHPYRRQLSAVYQSVHSHFGHPHQ